VCWLAISYWYSHKEKKNDYHYRRSARALVCAVAFISYCAGVVSREIMSMVFRKKDIVERECPNCGAVNFAPRSRKEIVCDMCGRKF